MLPIVPGTESSRLKPRVLIFISVVLMTIIAVLILDNCLQRGVDLRARMVWGDQIVECLSQYRSQFGHYPASLDDLLRVDGIKVPSLRRGGAFDYWRRGTDHYSLWLYTGFCQAYAKGDDTWDWQYCVSY